MKVLQCLQSAASRGLSANGGVYEGTSSNGMPFSIVPPPPPGYIKGEGIGGGTGESPGSHRFPGGGDGTGGSPGYHDRREQPTDRSFDMHAPQYHDRQEHLPDKPYEMHRKTNE